MSSSLGLREFTRCPSVPVTLSSGKAVASAVLEVPTLLSLLLSELLPSGAALERGGSLTWPGVLRELAKDAQWTKEHREVASCGS